MKYRLINKATDEEHLCDKVTIGGSYPMFEMEKEQNNAKQFYILNLKI